VNRPLDFVETLALLSFFAVAFVLFKLWSDKRSKKVKAFLDKQQWFRIIAMPVQKADIVTLAAQHSWRLAETMAWKDGTCLFKFEKMNKSATAFSELNEILGNPARPQSAESRACKFQIKIVELSTYEGYNAQTH
jgi:hypothetical protein